MGLLRRNMRCKVCNSFQIVFVDILQLTERTSQLCCEHSHCVFCELTNHLPVGVQVTCAAVVTHYRDRHCVTDMHQA